MHSFDVIVIGSGPSGCSAAIGCATAGLSVLLITDKHEEAGLISFDLARIESIHPGVISYLDSMDMDQVAIDATAGYYYGIYQNGVYTALGKDEEGPWQGVHILRDVFDQGLLAHTRGKNVTIVTGQKVEDFIMTDDRVTGIKTKTHEWQSRYCIDATGKSGLGGKKLNFSHQFFSPPLFCWSGISGEIETYPVDPVAAHFIPKHDGWTWLAPLPPNQCSWTKLSLVNSKEFSPPEEIRDYPVIGSVRFANMRWRLYRPLVREGILLCGDAGGILDPAAGQGILNSLRSGVIAANIVIQCLNDPDRASFHLAMYDSWFVGEFERKVKQLGAYYEEQGIRLQ